MKFPGFFHNWPEATLSALAAEAVNPSFKVPRLITSAGQKRRCKND